MVTSNCIHDLYQQQVDTIMAAITTYLRALHEGQRYLNSGSSQTSQPAMPAGTTVLQRMTKKDAAEVENGPYVENLLHQNR